MNKLIDWLLDHKKEVLFILLAVFISCGVIFYMVSRDKPVPMATISQNTPTEIAGTMIKLGQPVSFKEAKTISREIDEVKKKPPQQSWKTPATPAGEKQADDIAQAISKSDKADVMLKEEVTTQSNEKQNNYYSLHLEKKWALGIGGTVIDSKAYMTVAIEHNNLEVLLHSKNLKQIDGASILYKKRF